MLYKYFKRTHNFLGRFLFYFILVFDILVEFFFNKIMIPHELVGYEMIIASSVLRASRVFFHLISNARVEYLLINLVLLLRETVADLSYATRVEDGFFVEL